MLSTETIHATCVAIGDRAVLLVGPSGSGKSDLGLRLIDRGATLVSDDYTILERQGDGLRAKAPSRLAGRLEVRGVGIVELPHRDELSVTLVFELAGEVDRFPLLDERRNYAGVELPLIVLNPFAASAPIKVELALARVG